MTATSALLVLGLDDAKFFFEEDFVPLPLDEFAQSRDCCFLQEKLAQFCRRPSVHGGSAAEIALDETSSK